MLHFNLNKVSELVHKWTAGGSWVEEKLLKYCFIYGTVIYNSSMSTFL